MCYFRLLVASIFVAQALAAYGAEREWCNKNDFAYDSAHPMSAARLLPTVRDPGASDLNLMEEDWQQIDTELVQSFRNFVFDESLDENDPNLQLFDSQLDLYLDYDELRIQYMRARFNDVVDPNQMSWEFEPDPDTHEAVSLFLLCPDLAADREGQAIAYFSDALFEYGRVGHVSAIKLTAGVVGDIYSSHKNRLFNGLPMWPQETWLNGLSIDFEENEPTLASRRQWIFLRPGIAPALRFDGTDNSELDAALVVEAFGFINYKRGSEFKKWQGLSAMVTVTGDNGVGYGAMYRYNSWTLGGAYHNETDDWLLYVSVDLYNLVVPQDQRTSSANTFLSHLAVHFKGEAVKKLDEVSGLTP